MIRLQTDPFNRSHLAADMLIPNTELKARIEEFIRSQESKRREGLNMQSSKGTIQPTSGEMLIDHFVSNCYMLCVLFLSIGSETMLGGLLLCMQPRKKLLTGLIKIILRKTMGADHMVMVKPICCKLKKLPVLAVPSM